MGDRPGSHRYKVIREISKKPMPTAIWPMPQWRSQAEPGEKSCGVRVHMWGQSAYLDRIYTQIYIYWRGFPKKLWGQLTPQLTHSSAAAMPTPAYADGDVPTVTVGTNCADGIFSCADGYMPSAPCLRPVVQPTKREDARRAAVLYACIFRCLPVRGMMRYYE
jgi:hypothetical protein